MDCGTEFLGADVTLHILFFKNRMIFATYLLQDKIEVSPITMYTCKKMVQPCCREMSLGRSQMNLIQDIQPPDLEALCPQPR